MVYASGTTVTIRTSQSWTDVWREPQQIVEAILWTWSSQPSYGVHRDRKFWSSKLVLCGCLVTTPRKNCTHVPAGVNACALAGRNKNSFHTSQKTPLQHEVHSAIVLRKIKTYDNNAKPYTVCSTIQKCFAEALYIVFCCEIGRYTGVRANT